MRAISFSDIRKNLANEIDRVTDDHQPVLITRGRGKPAAVLISVEDYGSYEETEFLLRSPENRRRLLESVAELESGGGAERDLLE